MQAIPEEGPMVRTFCASGNHESVKCGVHGAVGVLVGLCAIYNITACFYRRDRHLRFNAALYTLAVAWEIKQTLHHLVACGDAEPVVPAAAGECAARQAA
jgi:hypothetical protein